MTKINVNKIYEIKEYNYFKKTAVNNGTKKNHEKQNINDKENFVKENFVLHFLIKVTPKYFGISFFVCVVV